MNNHTVKTTVNPSLDEVAELRDGLKEFNTAALGVNRIRKEILLSVRDENGGLAAGLFAFSCLRSLEIDLLWVHKNHRRQGLGKQLLSHI